MGCAFFGKGTCCLGMRQGVGRARCEIQKIQKEGTAASTSEALGKETEFRKGGALRVQKRCEIQKIQEEGKTGSTSEALGGGNRIRKRFGVHRG